MKFEYLNQGAIENIGYGLDEAKNLTPLDIKPELSPERFTEMTEALQNSETNIISFSTIHLRKDGSTYPVDVYLQPTIYSAKPCYMAIILDTTERESMKQEVKVKEEMMIAQSRNAAMGEMIGMIAHQWRQPITVIAMGANNIMLDIELKKADLEEFKEYAKNILAQTNYLSKTIDDFRNYFRPNKEIETVFM